MTITAGRIPLEAARPVKLRQLPGLNGLRALAVVAVIVYHLDSRWLPGGFLGVDVFFVISGYLITSLLLSEHQQTGGVRILRFWARRARRLLPAVAALLVGITLLAAVFARDALGPLRGDLPASALYVMNWRLLFEHQSYISSFGRPPLLQHLWSLSVEEQFYLLWPLSLLFLRNRLSRLQIAGLALAGAAVSSALMAGLFSSRNPSVVYFASYTHAQGLLIGCALAAAVPPWRMTASVAPQARRLLEWAGGGAMLIVIAGMALFGFGSSITYKGGMVIVDLSAAVVVATVAHPASRLGAGLGRQPLRWLGLRSYSLYLWHWPIFEMTRPGLDLAWSTGPDVVLRLALTGAAAELSYRFVEQPWRDGRAQIALAARRAGLSRPQMLTVAAAPLALLAFILATAPSQAEPTVLTEGSTAAARTVLTVVPPLTDPGPDPSLFPRPLGPFRIRPAQEPGLTGSVATSTTVSVPATPPTAVSGTGPTGIVPTGAEPILAIGDSVLLAASPGLTAAFGPAITIDAAVGRQVATGLARLAAYRASGALSKYRTVLIDLGTNGPFAPDQFTQLASLLAGVPHVVVYDVHVPRSWEATTNGTVTQGVAAHPAQMKLVDWNGAAGATGLLYSDGVHPDPVGAAVYSRLLTQALTG